MRCEELMTAGAEFVRPEDTCQFAALMMREGNYGFLPVIDTGKSLVGVLTDRDLVLRILVDARPATTKVWEVMTKDVATCQFDDEVSQAARRMSRREVSRLVVLDAADEMVGILSLSDLAQAMPEREMADTLRRISDRAARERPLS